MSQSEFYYSQSLGLVAQVSRGHTAEEVLVDLLTICLFSVSATVSGTRESEDLPLG